MKGKRLIEALVVHIARLVECSMLMKRRAASGNTHRHRLIADAGETTG
jgi:hypothetical protein